MIFSCFTRRSFQNVLQPWWTVYNDFYPGATEVTSNLLSLAWRLRLAPIVGSNATKPYPIYASLRLAFHPKCALSARKCIAQYRLKFQISTANFFLDPPLCSVFNVVRVVNVCRSELIYFAWVDIVPVQKCIKNPLWWQPYIEPFNVKAAHWWKDSKFNFSP